jgi:hypothetical protein
LPGAAGLRKDPFLSESVTAFFSIRNSARHSLM